MKRRLKTTAVRLWLPIGLILLWWFGTAGSDTFFWPSSGAIWEAFHVNWLFERWSSDLVPSLQRLAMGYGIAVVVGIALGVGLGASRLARRLLTPSFEFFRALPTAALLPLMTVLLGIGDAQKVAIIALGATWPILLSTTAGVQSVEPGMRDVARSFRYTPWQRVKWLLIPAAAPQAFAGLRVALAIALALMVVAEMASSVNGVGFFTLQSQQLYAVPEMWSGIIMLGLIGYTCNRLFIVVEWRLLAWHRGWRDSTLNSR